MIVLTKSDTLWKKLLRVSKKEDIREKLWVLFRRCHRNYRIDSMSKKGLDNLINKIDKMTDEIEDKNTDTPAELNQQIIIFYKELVQLLNKDFNRR
ncbi:hypothetical protein Q5M85_08275 [Paraclostridium bifermentans]|nr:hypothetical protein [Paraclostridium bifermentans]